MQAPPRPQNQALSPGGGAGWEGRGQGKSGQRERKLGHLKSPLGDSNFDRINKSVILEYMANVWEPYFLWRASPTRRTCAPRQHGPRGLFRKRLRCRGLAAVLSGMAAERGVRQGDNGVWAGCVGLSFPSWEEKEKKWRGRRNREAGTGVVLSGEQEGGY